MPLKGTLKDLSLPNLVQLQCSERRQVQVRVTQRGREAILAFADGELIHASLGALTGENAVYELLTWGDGDFQVSEEGALPLRNVETPWNSLLLEGLRRLDEARAEHSAVLEAALRAMRGKQGLHTALIVNAQGTARAEAAEEGGIDAPALIAFLAGRAESIKKLMGLEEVTEIFINGSIQKLWIEKQAEAYLGCWIESSTAIEPLKAALHLLNDKG